MTRFSDRHFEQYFQELHGYPPFPWQKELTKRVLEQGAWPDLLDVPTGLGKTSALDVALFVLVARPEIAPRRTLLVVDRRVVVDQAAQHVSHIRGRLTEARSGVLVEVVAALRELWGGDADSPPFEITVLRGGMPKDEAWAQRPDRPVVALSTVDQVGSRLLFRGYGVSPSMAPVHAGLLGQDALILLDEVQLSTSFAETLNAIQERWRLWRERGSQHGEALTALLRRWSFVQMSATPVTGASPRALVRHTLGRLDLEHEIVRQRREAHKLAALAEPIATPRSDEKSRLAVVEAFSRAVSAHIAAGAQRLAVIVNRVETARAIHEELLTTSNERAEIVLLTGRMRPIDRDKLLGDVKDPESLAVRIVAGSARPPLERPVVVVSTQTIEAGADFDFDALITECASLDALRQRFGRLDRRGEKGTSRATILIRRDQTGSGAKEDPIYGASLSETWSWLEGQAGADRIVDFGIAHFPEVDEEEKARLCSRVKRAPVLLPAHLDAWAQTQPRGAPEPDVALWLHGEQRGTPEVRVIWRADLDDADWRNPESSLELERFAAASLAAVPPSSLESISLPLPVFQAWIAKMAPVDLADVEGAGRELSPDVTQRSEKRALSRAYLIVENEKVTLRRDPRQAYPEATIVVPASYGGLRHGNWSPNATEPVSDRGDEAQLRHRGRPTLRLVPRLLRGLGLSEEILKQVPRTSHANDPEFSPGEAVRAFLEGARGAAPEAWRRSAEVLLDKSSKLRVVELEGSEYYVAVAQRRSARTSKSSVDVTSWIVNDDQEGGSFIGQEIGLDDHLDDVRRWTRVFATNLGLPVTLAEDLALAARLHDIGKADPRFQRLLHGGSAVRAAASSRLLAKSAGDSADRAARELARERAQYPRGYRHEILSVEMLEKSGSALADAHDPELVLHLVGSHHGWCRPFAPPVEAGAPQHVRLELDGVRYDAETDHELTSVGSTVAARYWSLTERYGWWTLAWFEAIVRLADHRASEESSLQKAK